MTHSFLKYMPEVPSKTPAACNPPCSPACCHYTTALNGEQLDPAKRTIQQSSKRWLNGSQVNIRLFCRNSIATSQGKYGFWLKKLGGKKRKRVKMSALIRIDVKDNFCHLLQVTAKILESELGWNWF